jgi:hypothetical protein
MTECACDGKEKMVMRKDSFERGFISNRKGLQSSGKNLFFQKQFTVVYSSTVSDLLAFSVKEGQFFKATEFSTCFICIETCDP